jgi:lipopolysaccharide/colanic/teichoic acid biosynthesis glycosyltransferase
MDNFGTMSRVKRADVLRELQQRYEGSSGRIRFAWKRNAWIFTVYCGRVAKRTLDIVVASVALIMLSPIFLIVGLLIWAHDRGAVIFWQARVGQWGREFPFPKFRSMVANAEALKAQILSQNQHSNGITFKMKRDPRITPIGRFIRKASIDELPQLWCVLRGDMSLVGPRPPVPQEVARYSLSDRRRLDVKPGLTCFWQVEGRGDIAFAQQVDLDVRYIHSQSVWLDMWLLLRTIPAVILGAGAY